MTRTLKFGMLSLALASVIGCAEVKTQQGNGAPPPPVIDVATVSSIEITDWHTFTTRTVAPEEVQLRPRVTGIIESVRFTEGSYVKEGDILFSLDKRAYQAELKNLEAQLKRSKAALRQAKSEYERGMSLAESKAISVEQVDARRALFDQRSADVDSIESSLNIARLNLDFSDIKAPISGKISLAYHTKGNTVRATETVLTNIVASDTIETYFEIDERTWNNKFASLENLIGLPVRMELTGSKKAIFGNLDFIDNMINSSTGTIKVRAVFDNESGALLPGAFARVSIAPTDFSQQIIVPERAIGTDLKNKFILVVKDENTLTYRPIQVGKRLGDFRIVTSGLKAGEKIAANGPAKVGPGMPINPKQVELELPKSLLVSDFLTHLKSTTSVMGAK
ncbi:efflux RND transporter periplasmic adaptor subunit [Psychrosphaera aestuarii]|uniref:efflux RND transporter periplasmic adaptor subunit n=1 Tax=Psychrosphaera aestuarii TaxID=1266052 RepID=UPI001B31AFDA|nr:efflux RND transporter periplasmic adaptor subunit [Psychrosphaera aestuarii]